MNKLRADILHKIRRRAGQAEYSDEVATSIIEKRLSLHARGPIPVANEPLLPGLNVHNPVDVIEPLPLSRW